MDLVSFAEQQAERLLGPEQKDALKLLTDQWPVLLELVLRSSTQDDVVLRLFGALSDFCWMTGRSAQGADKVVRERLLNTPPCADSLERAVAWKGLASLAFAAGRFDEAMDDYEKAAAIARNLERKHLLARILDRFGMVARQMMRLEQAAALHAEAKALHVEAGSSVQEIALCINNAAVVELFRGHVDQSAALHEEALKLRRNVDARGTASSLNNLGICARVAGHPERALGFILEGRKLREQLGDVWGLAGSDVQLAMTLTALQRPEEAQERLNAARSTFLRLGDKLGQAECWEAAAAAASSPEERAAHLAQADELRRVIGAPRPPCFDH